MILDFALLADRASGQPDGKVDIVGGGVSHITSAELPSAVASLTLVVRLLLEDSDRGTVPVIQFRVRRGESVLSTSPSQQIPAEVTNHVNMRAGEHAAILVVAGIGQLSFSEYGQYAIELLLDGTVIVSKALAVIRAGGARKFELTGPSEEEEDAD